MSFWFKIKRLKGGRGKKKMYLNKRNFSKGNFTVLAKYNICENRSPLSH